MKSNMSTILICLSAAAIFGLAGCAQDTGVMLAKDTKSNFDDAAYDGEIKVFDEDTTNGEQYRVFQQGATGFIPLSVVSREVEEQAFKFCDNKGKSPKKLKEVKSVPPHILGNFPRAELLFVCIPKPSLLEDQLYIRLTNLKKLLADGVITHDEFEQQKAKVLNPK